MHHWNHIHSITRYNPTQLAAQLSLRSIHSPGYAQFVFSTLSLPLPARFCEMASSLQEWLWVEECCLALLCAPRPHIIIQLLVNSEFTFYRLFFVVPIFALMSHVSMGLRLSDTIYCDSPISLQNLQPI